jgi:hypothetical protein
LFGTAAMAVAAAQFGVIGAANAQPGKAKPADVPQSNRERIRRLRQ